MKKYIIISLLILVVLGVFIFISTNEGEIKEYSYNTYDSNGNTISNVLKYTESKKVTNYVKLDTDKGLIFAELYPNIAPKTVSNFKALVKDGFYKDMIFHRVINNFMIQTGDPTGTGNSGSERKIQGEFSSNGFENNLKHTKGVLSMARSDDKNSASSQFFIVQKDYPSLDGNYASFGRVIAGLEVVDKIALVKTNLKDKPIVDVRLINISFVNIK